MSEIKFEKFSKTVLEKLLFVEILDKTDWKSNDHFHIPVGGPMIGSHPDSSEVYQNKQ